MYCVGINGMPLNHQHTIRIHKLYFSSKYIYRNLLKGKEISKKRANESGTYYNKYKVEDNLTCLVPVKEKYEDIRTKKQLQTKKISKVGIDAYHEHTNLRKCTFHAPFDS